VLISKDETGRCFVLIGTEMRENEEKLPRQSTHKLREAVGKMIEQIQSWCNVSDQLAGRTLRR
jgi:hypothetical protein